MAIKVNDEKKFCVNSWLNKFKACCLLSRHAKVILDGRPKSAPGTFASVPISWVHKNLLKCKINHKNSARGVKTWPSGT